MKKIYILLIITIALMASPMPEDKALSLFASIKKSEYNWVLDKWEKEMKIKTRSRSSSRKSLQNYVDKSHTNEKLQVLTNSRSKVQ